jgi:4-amino-4-deoxy-L-arabinose transferase-like glycosyltransferase
MARGRAIVLVLVVWAVIYLPRLGSLEIKSEEGRRILPAVTMLETGNYIVPAGRKRAVFPQTSAG